MASGLLALLDDVAALAKLAAASVDDVAAASSKAGVKAAGVVIDDAAVTPRYVARLEPARELPIIAQIARGSLRNKLVFLLPIAMLLSEVAAWAITPLLMLGGVYLCYEGVEKVLHALRPSADHGIEIEEVADAAELERRQVAAAVRTDFILSAEIMAISLNALDVGGFWTRVAALAIVAVAITLGVYGAVGLIVKLDDVGLHLSRTGSGAAQAIGRGLLGFMPKLMTTLTVVGTAAMIWVGGGIIVHGLDHFDLTGYPGVVHDLAHDAGHATGALGGIVRWGVEAVGYAIAGLLVGSAAVAATLAISRGRRGDREPEAAADAPHDTSAVTSPMPLRQTGLDVAEHENR